MKLAAVLLIASSIVAVYSLADPTPQSRGKPRFKSQFRSRTGTASAVENKPKSDFLRESVRTPIREIKRQQPTTTTTTTTEKIFLTEVTTFKPEPKPLAITPKLENNLIETNPVTDFPSYANATAPAPGADCQQNDLLNRLLLRVLLSGMMSTTTQNPLMENLNRLFNISPTPAASPTTVVTSTAVSTITQLFSTIVSVMFRNRRFPTTIFSSSTLVVTEFQTITSTLGSFDSPFRFKREVGIENDLQSSLMEPNSPATKKLQPTEPLSSTDVVNHPESAILPTIDIDRLILVLNHPEIQEAWTQFLKVLNRVIV